MKEFTSTDFLTVIDKLPHSRSRVPFTYHHDYLRQHSCQHNGLSRSEVAAMTSETSSDTERYAIALVAILDTFASAAFYHLNMIDVPVCRAARQIADDAMARYASLCQQQ